MKPSLPILLLVVLAPGSVGAEEKDGQVELARLLHSLIVAQAPRQHEDLSQWGKTIPLPANVRRPGLKRTVIKVGDRLEVPHGPWNRSKVWLDDPNRDITLRVTELRPVQGKGSRLGLEATLALHGEQERVQWVNGVKLLGLTIKAELVIVASFDVDVAVQVKTDKLPPEVVVEPKVTRTSLTLKQFEPQRIGPVQLAGKDARGLGEELKGTVQEWLKAYEPRITERLNETLVASVKSGKAKLLLQPLGGK